MSDKPSDDAGDEQPDDEGVDGTQPDSAGAGSPWPRRLRGVTETVVATLGPNDRWNQAALGVHATGPESERDESGALQSVTAYTYGKTRTRRNLYERGGGVVQFTADALDFAEAALGVFETETPVVDSADAWVRVDATQTDARDEAGTRIETWRLDHVESTVRRRVVPDVNRGHAAVVDATVAASRLGVDGFEDDELLARLDHAASVVATCGGQRERTAIHRVAALAADWNPDPDGLPERSP